MQDWMPPDDFRVDYGRVEGGRTFIRVVHLPTGKERIQVGLGSDDSRELVRRFVNQIRAELGR